ncbi:MAG: DUF5368 domain-containing protein [Paracoccus sp. (in: a-proteobacteria)]|nr:DUF5368 domain-containing protein [Paracoccus sp. (in: a-proteobacteria)]
MKELTPSTLLAVFVEMFGSGLFWAMVGLTAMVTAAYLFVLIRDRKMSMKRFLVAQLSMPFGAVAAVAFVMMITNSRPANIGGPIDLIVLLGVALLGAVGTAILVYTLQSLLRRNRAATGQ